MLELMSYGLTGLAAVVVTAFCCAFSEVFPLVSGRHSIETKDKTHKPLSCRSGEKGLSALYSGVTSGSMREEVFHG